MHLHYTCEEACEEVCNSCNLHVVTKIIYVIVAAGTGREGNDIAEQCSRRASGGLPRKWMPQHHLSALVPPALQGGILQRAGALCECSTG